MRVFKFGGASIKNVEAVKNVLQLLQHTGYEDTFIVVSAMGKTTNALEQVVAEYFEAPQQLPACISSITAFHFDIVDVLFASNKKAVKETLLDLIEDLKTFFQRNKSPNRSFVYDQVVSYGELLSSTIMHQYLLQCGMAVSWLDARRCIKTDNYYRGARLHWDKTREAMESLTATKTTLITQGFIGSDENNFTTTIGREGSDYSAAIFAYLLNAESVTIWKDVPGVLNADPRHFDNTQLLHHISYEEAIELAFYGASVIHPKTLQPLQQKEIPLHVKPFLHPSEQGTTITKGHPISPKIPCFILKKHQVLLQLSSRDFSFIIEENISAIFALLQKHKMRVDLIQNSAITFSVCVNDKYNALAALVQQLEAKFKVDVHPKVSLYTIRHYDQQAMERITNGKKLLLEQRTATTLQYVFEAAS